MLQKNTFLSMFQSSDDQNLLNHILFMTVYYYSSVLPGKLQDMELNDSDVSGDENDDENEENEPDKQMGDVDAEETVDEKMWGDFDEEDDSPDNQKEERGEGADGKRESQLVAKDENQGAEGEFLVLTTFDLKVNESRYVQCWVTPRF